MEEQTAQFLPFHAVNEFMRNEYRLEVVRATLNALPGLPENFRVPIEQMTRKFVQVPGFRNSAKAPLNKRVKPTAEAFEKSPYLVAAILAAWAEAHPELRRQVYDLLAERNWGLLPPEVDRTQLPGFGVTWPNGENFDLLNQAFIQKYPANDAKSDDISLMIVWMAVRLPYQFEDEPEDEEEDL
jgi:hypothetical protein